MIDIALNTPETIAVLGAECGLVRAGSCETRWRGRHPDSGWLIVAARYRSSVPSVAPKWTVRVRLTVTRYVCGAPSRPHESRYELVVDGYGETLEESEERCSAAIAELREELAR